MQNLSLPKRPAVIGAAISTRTENHGDEKVPALTIPISNILLSREELGVILQDSEAWEALFTQTRSSQAEPRFLGIDPLNISDKFKDAKVTLTPDNTDEPLILKPATLSKMVIYLLTGGIAYMSCNVLGAPPPEMVVDVLSMLNRKCTLSILNGKLLDRHENQQELDLGEPVKGSAPPDEEAEDEDQSPKKKRAAKKK